MILKPTFELARQLNMACFFMITFDNYQYEGLAEELNQRICTTGYNEFNENGDYEPGVENIEPAFRLSIAQDEKLTPLIESFQQNAMLDYIPNALAYRDLIEKHGLLEDFVIIQSPELYDELCDFENDYKM